MDENYNKTPETPVVFSKAEVESMDLTANKIQAAFLQAHVEITAPSNSDLTHMIRDEKQMYSSMGILFAVHCMEAEKKRTGA